MAEVLLPNDPYNDCLSQYGPEPCRVGHLGHSQVCWATETNTDQPYADAHVTVYCKLGARASHIFEYPELTQVLSETLT